MTNMMEPVGKDLDQKAADELIGVERHQLVGRIGLGPVILPPEGHALAVKSDEPAIGDGDPVSVAGQVGGDSVGSAEGLFGMDDPFDLPQCGKAGFKGGWLGQAGLVGEKLHAPGVVNSGQLFKKQTTEEG